MVAADEYTLTVGNTALLSGSPFSHCNGTRFDLSSGLASDAGSIVNGTDSRLGAFESITYELSFVSDAVGGRWAPALGAHAVAMQVTFKYYASVDAIIFEQRLPWGCEFGLNTTSVPPDGTPSHSGSLGELAASLTTSTGFPVFRAGQNSTLRSKNVGYMQWRGRFSDLETNHGVGISEFQGGTDAGPLALFDAATGLNPLVLSTADNFFTMSMGLTNCRQAVPASAETATCTIHDGVDYFSNDLYSVTATTLGQCCDACIADPQCTCFSFSNTSVGKFANKCWLKTSTQGAMPSTHVSGTLCDSDTDTWLSFGVQGYEQAVRSGATFSSVAIGSSGAGLNAGMHRWGEVLTAYHNTSRVAPDITEWLGYGTDNGAYISGHINVTQDMLVSAIAGLNAQHVPVKYIQLDPWWFRGNPYWLPSSYTFPDGLASFCQKVGIPLLLYSFLWDPEVTASYPPFKQRGFGFVNSRRYMNRGDPNSRFAQSDGVTSASFYDYLFSIYADQQKVMVAYETDFMDLTALLTTAFLENSTLVEQWHAGQDKAASKRGLPWQQCMNLPAYAMDALKRPSVTNARGTNDANPQIPNRWRLGYTALFYWPIGIRPFLDNIWTTAVQPGNVYNMDRPNTELEAGIAVLSVGPVWLGDKPGLTNASLANMTCRADGLLLSPSRPLTPVDAMFALGPSQGGIAPQDAAEGAEVWLSHSDVPVSSAANVQAVPSGPLKQWMPVNADLSPADVYRSYTVLGVDLDHAYFLPPSQLWPVPASGTSFLASAHSQKCSVGQPATDCGVVTFGDMSPLRMRTGLGNVTWGQHGFDYWTLSPTLPNGFTMLGEVAKFARFSPKRFTAITSTSTGINMQIEGAPGEEVRVQCVDATGVVGEVSMVIASDGMAFGSCA